MNKDIEERQERIKQFISDKKENNTCHQLVLTDDKNGEQILPNKKGYYEDETIKKRRSPRDFGKRTQQNLDNHKQKTLGEQKTGDEIISGLKSEFEKNRIKKAEQKESEQKEITESKRQKLQNRAKRLFNNK